jgi:hypothetical protein
MNTREAASAIGTEAKTLRQFLRQSKDYRNAGSGGRYNFKAKDITKLRKHFEEWADTKPSTKRKAIKPPPDNPGLPKSVIGSTRRQDRERVLQLSRERVDRLEASLLARGLHISQLKDRESFRRVSA